LGWWLGLYRRRSQKINLDLAVFRLRKRSDSLLRLRIWLFGNEILGISKRIGREFTKHYFEGNVKYKGF